MEIPDSFMASPTSLAWRHPTKVSGQSLVKPSGMSDEQLLGSKWSGRSAGGDLVLSVRFKLQLWVEARRRLLAWPHHLGVEALDLTLLSA